MGAQLQQTGDNPVLNTALESAKTKIDGYELGIDSYNKIAADQLRKGNPTVINQTRKNRQNINEARKALGLKKPKKTRA